MEKTKIEKEVAQADFDRWFEVKKLPKTRREGESESMVNELLGSIEEGFIVLQDDGGVKLFLREPLTGERPLNELNFVPRLTAGQLMSKTGYAKTSQEKQVATIAAFSDEVGGTIRALGTIDLTIAAVITNFY
jgi:hypothetical protein